MSEANFCGIHNSDMHTITVSKDNTIKLYVFF